MTLDDWARKWNIPAEAIDDYKRMVLSDHDHPLDGSVASSEGGAVKRVRLAYARQGIILWRNNVGVARDETDRVIRYGLANDSKQVNDRIKSSDLIGIKPGGQFMAREVKAPGWKYRGDKREQAQLKFLELVISLGGDAAFTTGE